MTDPRPPLNRSDALEDEVVALRADNARLRRLLDEEGMPDSLRHAFRDTVAMLRVIMRRTADSAVDVQGYNGHLTGRLDAIVKARLLTDAFGEAGLRTLVAEALNVYLVRDGEQAALEGPDVRLRPKAAEVFALAMHELATNAVAHGVLGGGGGVTVSWRVDPGEDAPTLELMWKETGAIGLAAPGRSGFGTVVLEEMLAYDLRAQARLSYELDGLRCRIQLPLTPRSGRVVVD